MVVVHGNGATVQRTKHEGMPCTFLVDGKCSIYKHRPLVCRMLVNMDSDERLCKVIPNYSVPVPYLNNVNFNILYADLLGKKNLADVREWFPNGLQ